MVSRLDGTPRWAAYVLVVAIHLIALGFEARPVSVPSQILLMPVLALVALTARPGRLRTWTLTALCFSFLGDTLPRLATEEWEFPLLLGSFLIAHLAWITGFWPLRRSSALWREPWTLIPYLLVAVAVLVWCLPNSGVLAAALIGYGLALLLTASLATAFGWPGWLGGALFVVSDSLIAIESFTGFDFTGRQIVIMATYTIAHGLLVLGVVRHAGERSVHAP